MHAIKLLLKTTEYDETIIKKRFHATSHIHNITVKHAKRLLKRLKYNAEYQTLLKEYTTLLKKKTLSKDDKTLKRRLSQEMTGIRMSIGLSEYDLQSYIKTCAKQYRKCLSSQQIQKEVSRVWCGVEDVLFDDGKNIHYKKYMNFTTIGGKSNTNGVKFNKNGYYIDWLGLHIKCKLPKNSEYIIESLNDNISYCEIERKMFPNGWHYYVIVYLKNDAPTKIKSVGCNTMGIDPGTSTIAGVSDNKAVLKELAPNATYYNKKIANLQYHMDLSKRMLNPQKYNSDGTIKKHNRDRWKYSNSYLKNQRKLKSLCRQKSAYIKQSHEELCNELIADSVNFIVEDMSYKELQKKAKNTEKQSKMSEIKKKDGTVVQIYKYKRKKRFGKSLNNRAPAMFLTILERKSIQYGGSFVKINTQTFKASQYDHVTNTYNKVPLSQRTKTIGNTTVQRDLYSAFLIKNADKDLQHADKDKCIYEFGNFIELQNDLLNNMINNKISMKQCFGF